MKKYSFPIAVLVVVIFFTARYFYFKPDVVNGEKAEYFEATLRSGEAFNLNQLQGKYVLLDFWGSWCFPCRKENPKLVRLYDKYAEKSFKDAMGFEIVSVGVEENMASWQRAIEVDSLFWPYQIFDKSTSLRLFNSPIANKYGVKEVPTTFLLNSEGVIVGVNLPIEDIDKLLTEKLKK